MEGCAGHIPPERTIFHDFENLGILSKPVRVYCASDEVFQPGCV